MQYILTQEEYDALCERQKVQFATDSKELQRVATLAALHIPINLSWRPNEPAEPNGCYLTGDGSDCDECPVQKICPAPKEWSK